MPLPKPTKQESQTEFLGRCMSDDQAVFDFPDNQQRLAVCYRQWDAAKESNVQLDRKFCTFEVKEATDAGHVVGYGSVFGNEDFGGDIVEKGAFKESLKSETPLMLWSHDMYEPPIGEWTKAVEDDHGLLMEGQLYLGVSEKVDLIHKGLKNQRHKTGLSIGFYPIKQAFDDEREVRLLQKVDLKEVSFVNFPMNDKARLQAAKARHQIMQGEDVSYREFEAFLRDAGLSRRQAKSVAQLGYDGLKDAGRDQSSDVKAARETVADVLSVLRS